jgi:hypothetical protein
VSARRRWGRRARVHAEDARVQRTLDIIARDEARHADLGRDVATWCAREGGSSMDHAIEAAVSAALGAIEDVGASSVGADEAALRAHGRGDRGCEIASREQAIWSVVSPPA